MSKNHKEATVQLMAAQEELRSCINILKDVKHLIDDSSLDDALNLSERLRGRIAETEIVCRIKSIQGNRINGQ